MAWLLLAAIAVVTAAPASADVPEGCWEEDRSDELGNITVVVICPPGVGNNPGDGSDESGGGGGNETRECTHRGGPIECETSAGTWNGHCYVKVADPQPEADNPVWGGREPGDGVIIQCTAPDVPALDCDADGGCPGGVSLQWAAAAPGAGPSPAALARQALAQMQLRMGSIGSTPPEGTTASLVGLPIWLWVSDPAPNTTGPITATASDGGVSVTVTATLDRIEYAMVRESGGGTTASTNCAGEAVGGTAYDASYEDAPSPTCGITADQNQRTGTYTITGTAYWTAEWSGGGQTGTIPVDVDNSIQLVVDELQVIQVG